MSVKSDILGILENSRGAYISGQALADRLHISRSAVWKAVNSLKEEGYAIFSLNKKGYSLDGDKLSAEGILAHFKGDSVSVQVLPTVDSTNNYAKREIALGRARDGLVVLSEEQTAGKGRLGRSFYSPPSNGVYMSIVLLRNLPIERASYLTITAAVAVCQAIESLTDAKPAIKWVNDIFLGDKKVCGILTEAASDFESGTVQSAVVGIGVNVRDKAFPPDIEAVVTSLYLEDLTRNALAAGIIQRFMALLDLSPEEIIAQYKARSMILGEAIQFTQGGVEKYGVAKDINDAGNLEVVLEDGSSVTLVAGDVSIRRRAL